MVALVFCGEEGGGGSGGGRAGAIAARGRGVGAGAEDGEAVGEGEEDGLRDGDEGEEDRAEALPQRQRALRPLLAHRRNHETQDQRGEAKMDSKKELQPPPTMSSEESRKPKRESMANGRPC